MDDEPDAAPRCELFNNSFLLIFLWNENGYGILDEDVWGCALVTGHLT